jgi:hypothetical protein
MRCLGFGVHLSIDLTAIQKASMHEIRPADSKSAAPAIYLIEKAYCRSE